MKMKKRLWAAVGLLLLFGIWTCAVSVVDVQPIGPEGSSVGLAAMNGFVHQRTGVHFSLYTVTDWLGLVPVAFGLGFAVLGLMQWVKRRHILRVDHSLLVLGVFYIIVIAAYLLFEMYPINYRPTLIEGRLEASYPSSTTLLVLCVMPTALLQLRNRIRCVVCRKIICTAIAIFTAFMVIGRLVSGVHWVSDIIGGALLSAGLVTLYSFVCAAVNQKK